MIGEANFYGNLPAFVRYSKVSASAKVIYSEICALTKKEGYCWATNDHLAQTFDVSAQTVSNWIKELKDADFIEVELIPERGNERKISLILDGGGLQEKQGRSIRKHEEGSIRKFKRLIIENKRNKNKVEIETELPFNSLEFQEAWEAWKQYRKEKGSKLTQSTIKRQLKQLGGYGEEMAIKSITQSIGNGWTGRFISS
jgi:DNA-binding transcriptional ArsR family regulator